jgi:hypothetical protein
MRTYIFHKTHPNIDPSRLRYDAFRVNLEIQWIGIKSTLERLLILDDVEEKDDIKYNLFQLPVFNLFIQNNKSMYVCKMELFKCI